ncbi:MAG: hypothetical protein HOP10_01555 [Chitinophagaceae bacterium]|nr:hypothetical protein [Chitinophagaceae bacterium]
MNFAFQFPIIDLRQAIQAGETLNAWPSADMTKAQVDELMSKAPFIKNFGKIESGPAGYFCNINCINSSMLQDNGFRIKVAAGGYMSLYVEKMVTVFNSYKRLYADGVYTTKTEFGFKDQLESMLEYATPDQPVHISDVLTHYMSMPLDVQDMSITNTDEVSNWITIKLSDLGPVLAKNYCRATTKKDKPAADEFVVNGEACITLAFADNKDIVLPANAEKLDQFDIAGNTVQLYGYKLNFEDHSFKVWLFQLPKLDLLMLPATDLELRNRRMNLFRLNAEKETMRILVNGLDPENADQGVKKYIKKTPIKIFKKERFSNSQDAVRNFALQSANDKVQFTLDDIRKVLDEYGLDNLKNLEQNMKTAPKKKTILFITSNPTDSNPIDFGEQFKKIDEAWQRGSDRDYFTLLNIKAGVERNKVMEILYTNEPDYLHITLHNSEIKGLYFQDAAKNPDPMPPEEFAVYIQTLTEQKKPEAVILCACNTLDHATAIKKFCNYAVGTNYVFPDDAAVAYANNFYTALFSGKKVSFCHQVAVDNIRFSKPPFSAGKDAPEVYKILQLIQPS